MNRPTQNTQTLTLFLSIVLLSSQVSLANESINNTLLNTVGATDYYKVTCSANGNDVTDHLGFKIIDTSVLPSEITPVDPQLINAHISKEVIDDKAMTLAAGDNSQELNIPRGNNGKYKISLDTVGTDPLLKNSLSYTIQYRCLNADNIDTKSSAPGLKSGKDVKKTLKNNKIAQFSVNCAAQNKISPPDTSSLYLKLDNTSTSAASPLMINAHISKEIVVKEALAIAPNGRNEVSVPLGNGAYKITLDTVGTNLGITKAQTYTIQYRCLNTDSIDTKSSALGLKTGKDIIKSIKNNSVQKFTVNCAAQKKITPADTDNLYLKIVNTSAVAIDPIIAALPVLNAQVYKSDKTLNTSDLTGDLLYSNETAIKGGDGEYFIAVNNTGTETNAYNSKQYSFQYSCLNNSNLETTTSNLELIQDQ